MELKAGEKDENVVGDGGGGLYRLQLYSLYVSEVWREYPYY